MSAPNAGRPVFGAQLCALTRAGLAAEIARAPAPAGRGLRLVVTMNLDHVVRLERDAQFRHAYAGAWAVTADGAPVFAYSRAVGGGAPERVTGSDLMADLARSWPVTRRPFFVVSAPATGAALEALFRARGFPAGAVAWASPAFGFEHDAVASGALVGAIVAHDATDLVMGLGAPKSEIWIDTHRAALSDLYAYAFGSGPDFLVGVARRAPAALGRCGLEWAWRVAHDPGRLWRRYFVDAWRVLPAVARDLRAPASLADERVGSGAADR